MLDKNTWGVKTRGQSEATLLTGKRKPKGLISAETKQKIFNPLNDTEY